MAIALATWLSAFILKFDGNLIILIDNIVVYLVTLLFKKVSSPDHLCQIIVYYNKIGLSWNLSAKFGFLD